MERMDVVFLAGGQNWINIGSRVALGLSGYYSRLPKGSTVSVTTADPGEMCFQGANWVNEGRAHMAITTPAWFVSLAAEGRDPYSEPMPLRTLAHFRHDDRMAFAVRKECGINSFTELREKKYPLKVSTVPPQNWHPALWGTRIILEEHGIALEDFEEWGGKLLSDRPRFINAPGIPPASEGFDAIFDEALMTRRWKNLTDNYDIVFLPIEDDAMKRLEARGWKPGVIEKERFRGMTEDVPTIDFSGWILFCREDLDEELAYHTIAAIDEQKESINEVFAGPFGAMTTPIGMDRLAADPPVPLHPGAERYYRENGYL